MAHEIDESNGRANMAFVNELPWHGLGQQLEAGATIDQWKTAAGLDWSVVGSDVQYKNGEDKLVSFDDRMILFRTDTGTPLSVVTTRYKPVQPPQVLEFFRGLTDELGNFTMETAGSLRGGRKIWALAKAKDKIKLSKTDTVDRYLLLATSYDFSIKTIVQQTSVRVVCSNTLGAAYSAGEGGNENRIAVSHMTEFKGDLVKQRLALDKDWSEFTKVCNLLADKTMTDKEAEQFFLEVFYPANIRKLKTFSEKGARNKVETLMGIYREAPGQKLSTAKGTVWGVLNAVTYWTDHQAKSKSADVRLDKAWFGDNAIVKTRATERALALIG